MNIKEISIKGFKSFGNNTQKLELNTQSGELILLTGANGNGKSSFINSFEYVLYGKCKGNKKKWTTLSNLPNRINGGDLLVSIKFESSSTEVSIERGISPNILKLFENGVENDRAGKSNIDDRIQNYIGMDIETFKSFISMSVNDFKNFISLSNEEKQMLLDKLFNLEIINVLNQILKEMIKSNKMQIYKFDAEISTLEDSIERIKDSISKSIKIEKENKKREIDQIRSLIKEKKDQYVDLKSKIEKLNKKEQEITSLLDKDKSELSKIGNEISNVIKSISLYNSGKCPTCENSFLTDYYEGLKSDLESKYNSMESIKKEIQSSISLSRERLSKVKKMIEDSSKSFFEINSLLKSYKSKIEDLSLEIDSDDSESINTKEFEKAIIEISDKKNSVSDYRSICQEKEFYYKELSKVFSEDGVKKNIIRRIIIPINHFISENIKSMNLPFHVTLDETFTANIKHFGTDVEYDSLSTGEMKLINLSILVSYLMMIKTKRHINILFLDEVFSSIDLDNISKIISLLKSFASQFKVNIFVVHHAILSEELFDRIIRIDKNVFTEIVEINRSDIS
jgi:exonuclease SbcC